MDRVSTDQRSWNMSRVRSKDTAPELVVRSFLFQHGFRFRLHVKNLPGHPDIVLPKYRTVVEVRGCFWHRHPGCRQATTPSSNVEFWQKKFNRNVTRDRNTEKQLNANLKKTDSLRLCRTKSKDVHMDHIMFRIITTENTHDISFILLRKMLFKTKAWTLVYDE